MSIQTSSTRKLVQRIKRRITPFYYEIVYGLITPRHVNTMNFGYAPITDELRLHYLSNDQGLQSELYWQAFKQLEVELSPDKVICEVSSGRGGGLAFLRNLSDSQVVGLERSPAARRYAAKHFQLDVRAATAPSLPLADASVDVFISIEAAHNYHKDAFVEEMRRCLKPGGVVLLADMNLGSDQHVRTKLESLYAKNGMTIDNWRDIRPNVLEALELDDDRKQAFLRYLVGPFKAEAQAYMATVDSHKYHEMKRDVRAYFIFRVRKCDTQ